MAEEGAGAADDALVQSVQRGPTSGMVEQGRLLLGSEGLIHHVQGLSLPGALVEPDRIAGR